MILKMIVLKKNYLILLFILSFVVLLPILIHESLHTTLLAFNEGSAEQILREKICLYGFDSFFSQVLIEFLFVVSIYCSFCNHIKSWKKTGLNALI